MLVVLGACAEPAPLRLPDLPPCGDPTSGHWDDRFHLPGVEGRGASVAALAGLPDGRIAVGGTFERAVATVAHDVAVWDGATWSQLADGLPPVRGLAVDDAGTLWAVGLDDPADTTSSYIARWNGVSWVIVVDHVDGAIRGIAAIDGGVAVFGGFQHIAGTPAAGLSVWNGATWSDAGLGAYSEVTTLTRTTNGYCIGGTMALPARLELEDGAACRDDAGWVRLGAATPGWPLALAKGPDGTWWAGGGLQWDTADGTDETYGIAFLAEDGTWQPLDGGVRGGDPYFPSAEVLAIAFDGDSVLFGGNFTAVGPARMPAVGLARWSRRAGWQTVAGNGAVSTYGSGYVASLLRDGVTTHVGGSFNAVGSVPATNVATIDGESTVTAWSNRTDLLGATGIADLATTRGAATIAATGRLIAGSFVGARAASLDDAWTTSAVEPPLFQPTTIATRSDGSPVLADHDSIIAWDGTEWTTLVQSTNGPSPILVDAEDRIYYRVATAAGSEVRRIDESDTTSSLGTVTGNVEALAVFDGMLVAVTYVDAGDASTAVAIMIDTDEGWRPLPGAPQGFIVAALSSPELGLVIVSRNEVVAWNGTLWTTLASAPADGGFSSATMCADGLFAAEYRYGDTTTSTLHLLDGVTDRQFATLSWAGDLALGPAGLYIAGGDFGESEIALWRF